VRPLASSPDRIRELVLRWGWNATAFQALEPGYRYFHARGGAIAFVDTGEAWVAAGAPLAPTELLGPIADDFVAAARRARRRACFALVERRFLGVSGLRAVQIGAQPIWDPRSWDATVAASRGLREQLRRARRKRVAARELSAEELASPRMRAELEELARRWLAARPMAALQFLVRIELFTHAALRRVFVAERDGVVVGVAALVPVPARAGFLLEDLLRAPEAPNGTAELLVDAAARALAKDGVGWLTMGLVALSGDVPPLLRALGRLGAPLYDFAGLAAFRRRMRPLAWAPLYVAYPERFGATAAVLATLRALAGGSLRRFAARTAMKRLSALRLRA
jgi:phosphatidylglycerol lysyltransferase